jgi:hypothetical protein
MAKDDVYCGAGPVPKGKVKGSMKDCAAKGQIRLFGVYKVDPVIAGSLKTKPKPGEKKLNKIEVRALIFKFKGRMQRIRGNLEDPKLTKAEKKKLNEELEEAVNEHNRLVAIFKKMDDGGKVIIKK